MKKHHSIQYLTPKLNPQSKQVSFDQDQYLHLIENASIFSRQPRPDEYCQLKIAHQQSHDTHQTIIITLAINLGSTTHPQYYAYSGYRTWQLLSSQDIEIIKQYQNSLISESRSPNSQAPLLREYADVLSPYLLSHALDGIHAQRTKTNQRTPNPIKPLSITLGSCTESQLDYVIRITPSLKLPKPSKKTDLIPTPLIPTTTTSQTLDQNAHSGTPISINPNTVHQNSFGVYQSRCSYDPKWLQSLLLARPKRAIIANGVIIILCILAMGILWTQKYWTSSIIMIAKTMMLICSGLSAFMSTYLFFRPYRPTIMIPKLKPYHSQCFNTKVSPGLFSRVKSVFQRKKASTQQQSTTQVDTPSYIPS